MARSSAHRRVGSAGGHVAVFALALSGCAEPEPEPGTQDELLTVQVAPSSTLRDLVARVDGPVERVFWSSGGNPAVEGLVVDARLLWPGETWTVTAVGHDGTEVSDTVVVPEPPGGNVLVILIDDVGVDKVGVWGSPTAPPTPTLDALAAQGMRFDRAYTSPVCSPTRGILISGRHARRTGLGWIADTGSRDYALPLDTWTLPEALGESRAAQPWADAAVGKWHMAGPKHPDVLTHPLDSGFSWFSGVVGNPKYADGYGYDRWEHNDNGVLTERTGYLTSATVDDALDRIEVMPEPWLMYLPMSAAHGPWTAPPPSLLTQPLPDDPTPQESYDAVLEALDHELGRLLDTLGSERLARTTVIVIGDNGTPTEAIDATLDPERQKHTLYEGGVNVPLIVVGPHVARPGTISDALVHVADIYPTVAEIAGVPLVGPESALSVEATDGLVALDGRSWLPLLADPDAEVRPVLYAEAFHPNGPGPDYGIDRRMVTDDHYKLVRNGDLELMFDLHDPGDDPDGSDLLLQTLQPEAEEAWLRLTALLDRFEQAVVFEGR